jgi:hypothetical protein
VFIRYMSEIFIAIDSAELQPFQDFGPETSFAPPQRVNYLNSRSFPDLAGCVPLLILRMAKLGSPPATITEETI